MIKTAGAAAGVVEPGAETPVSNPVLKHLLKLKTIGIYSASPWHTVNQALQGSNPGFMTSRSP